jgi:hypothetical protein
MVLHEGYHRLTLLPVLLTTAHILRLFGVLSVLALDTKLDGSGYQGAVFAADVAVLVKHTSILL